MTLAGVKPQRAHATHTPKWQRFQTNLIEHSSKVASVKDVNQKTHPYNRQYSHVYAQRLASLKPRCLLEAQKHCDAEVVDRVLELQEGVLSVVCGTLIKETGDAAAVVEGSKCHENDVLILEDESGRVTLSVENLHEWCTGIVVAMLGTVLADGSGILKVERIFSPTAVPHPKLQGNLESEQAPHLLLVSGLDCGASDVSSLPRDLLLTFLEGHLSPSQAAKVCRVVIAGGGCGKGSKTDPAIGVKDLDCFIAQVCAAGIPVDLIPGQDDPTTANWPQRPLHSCLLQHSTAFKNDMLSRTPNPFACELGDKFVMGCDGRNVQSLLTLLLDSKREGPISELQALRNTLSWGHMCPTGPDSVPTRPHSEFDPMVFTETPHVYFAGNCKEYDSELVVMDDETKSRIICVPRFADSKTAVLVNLATLDCELVRFEDE